MSTVRNPYISKRNIENSRIEKYRYELLKSGNAKDPEWIRRQIMSGRVQYPFFTREDNDPEWKSLTSESAKQMYADSLIGYLEKIGEQHEWDMHVEIRAIDDRRSSFRNRVTYNYRLVPMIRFSEFTIENSNGAAHDIKELFVFFIPQVTCIKDGKMVLRPSVPRGFRTLFHEDEYNSNYVHSHLYALDSGSSRERSARRPMTFCIGNDRQEELISLLGSNYDPHLFASFLMIIRTMVEWESLEGVPYMHIETEISSREVDQVSAPNHNRAFIEAAMYPILSSLLTTELAEKLDFTINENHYSVKITREAEDMIRDTLIAHEQYNFITKRISGSWVKFDASRANQEITDPMDEVFVFGGQEFKLTLYNDYDREDEDNHDDINTYRIYPKFLDYVKQQINAKFYEHQISRSFAQASS